MARTTSLAPGLGSPSSASTCSIATPGQALATRSFHAANSRAPAKLSPEASTCEDRAAGRYSVVTYSRTILVAWARGPSVRSVCATISSQRRGRPSGARS